MINWFPGHMYKTKKLIRENLQWVDVILEIIDARLPSSSRNPLLGEMLAGKPFVLLLNKADLAEENENQKWLDFYRKQGYATMLYNALSKRSKGEQKKLALLARREAREELSSRRKKGIKSKIVRLMVLGIPNVGKSTLINHLKGRGVALTGNKPGVTKGKQWIRLDNDLELLDLPGILWPKFTDPAMGYKLSVSGAIKAERYDPRQLAIWLLTWLKENKPGRIAKYYHLDETLAVDNILEVFCQKRGILQRGGLWDLDRGAAVFLQEFRRGKLGRITMDFCPVDEAGGK